MKLSIIIPVFNEEKTVRSILDKVSNLKLINAVEKELVIVNDCSLDNSSRIIENFISENKQLDITYLNHDTNSGKGAALHNGIKQAKGDYIIIQDADLEYDPNDYNVLLKTIIDDKLDVVYGSRFLDMSKQKNAMFVHSRANRFLTGLSNVFTKFKLTDMETCYKLFRSEIIKDLSLKEQRFGFEPEVTAQLSKVPNLKLSEVSISYNGRNYESGKKIGWKDGFRAIYCIIKYNLFS